MGTRTQINEVSNSINAGHLVRSNFLLDDLCLEGVFLKHVEGLVLGHLESLEAVLGFDYGFDERFELREMTLTHNVVFQPEVVEKAVFRCGSNCKQWLLIVHLDGIAKDMS